MIYHFEVFEQTGDADFKIRRCFMTYLQFRQKAVFLCEKETQLCRNVLAKLTIQLGGIIKKL